MIALAASAAPAPTTPTATTAAEVKLAVQRVKDAGPVGREQLLGRWSPVTELWAIDDDEPSNISNGSDLVFDELGGFDQGVSGGWFTYDAKTRSLVFEIQRADARMQVAIDGDTLEMVSVEGSFVTWSVFQRATGSTKMPAPIAVKEEDLPSLIPVGEHPRLRKRGAVPKTCQVPVVVHPKGYTRVSGPILGCPADYHRYVQEAIKFHRFQPSPGQVRTSVLALTVGDPSTTK